MPLPDGRAANADEAAGMMSKCDYWNGRKRLGELVDPTAQTEPLTIGQQIVSDYETDMIAEPCELAAAIDAAIATAVDLAELRAIFAQFFCAADQLSLGL